MSKKNCCPKDVVTWSFIAQYSSYVLAALVLLGSTAAIAWNEGHNSGYETGYNEGRLSGCNRLESHLTWRSPQIELPDCDWLLKTRKD